MTLQSAVEILLALAAVLLLGRDLGRAWRDRLRRPITLFVAASIAILLVGTLAGRAHPNPWWLSLPALVLVWEVARGWRQTPRCHLWETGIAAFAASLLIAVLGLGLAPGSIATALLAAAGVAGVIGVSLLWRSRRSEPRPWRARDPDHYERRRSERG
jgi:hypothetical protein